MQVAPGRIDLLPCQQPKQTKPENHTPNIYDQ